MSDDTRMLLRPVALHLLNRLQQRLSNPPAELVHASHPLWPLPPLHAATAYTRSRPLRVSILDASFNPPTLAHLALANAPRPSKGNLNCEGDCGDEDDQGGTSDYDAKLLLLSVRNADKSLKPGDATHIQRLEMMNLLAKHLRCEEKDPQEVPANVAVAIIDEPTFVGKSACLLQFLKQRLETNTTYSPANVHLQLSFVVGLDTLERLVAPRYYPSEAAMLSSLQQFLSPEADNSIVVCARRKSSPVPSSGNTIALADEFIKSGRIIMIDIGDEESTYSSTAVRTTIKQLGLSDESQNQWRRFVPADVADYIVQEKLNPRLKA